MIENLPLANGEPVRTGVTYDVEFDDCCVGGRFRAKLKQIFVDPLEPDFSTELRFENDIILTEWTRAEFSEVPDE